MTRLQLTPSYRAAPIRRIETLAAIVGLEVPALRALAQRASGMYREVSELKKDGTPRICYDAHKPLKLVQGYIKTRILDTVQYPPYLQGGISDPTSPRDYKSNAEIHVGARATFTTDIANFFPSIHAEHVYAAWEKILRCSPEVSEILTALTVRDGLLPQGARTSTHLANLVFFEREPALYKKLELTGISYSRFVDDIVWSSKRDLSKFELTEGIRLTYGMLKAYGFKPKRSKEDIFLAGERMEVNNLVTNTRVALPKEERKAIRAAVHQFISKVRDGRISGTPLPGFDSLHGRVQTLRRFHADDGDKLLAQLKTTVQAAALTAPQQT